MSQKALLLTEAHGRLNFSSVAKYTAGKGEVLVKSVAGALNPIDWKQIAYNLYVPSFPFILGGDVAGIVEEVGEGVTNVKKGDKVWGLAPRGDSRSGAFQEYVIVNADLIGKIPENLSFSDAAALPLGSVTAAVGLYRALQIPTPFAGQATLPADTILIWGGASSVGAYAVQLARLSGFKNIFATASPSNFDYVKSLGATQVFDYRAADVIDQIKTASGDKLTLIFDAAGTHDTSVKALGKDGGVVASTLAQGETTTENKTIRRTYGGVIFINEQQFGKELYGFLDKQLALGTYKPNIVEPLGGGLAGIEGGLALMKEGKVSAKKLVYTVSETPNL